MTSLSMPNAILDLKGLKCPLPALKTRKALTKVLAGEAIEVLCTDPMASIDIPNLIRETGDTLVSHGNETGVLRFVIRKAA